MSKTKHTPEPWAVYPNEKRVSFGHQHSPHNFVSIGSCFSRVTYLPEDAANAARIVACVNACAGIDNEVLLDDGVRKMREDRDELLKQLTETQQDLELAQASNKRLQQQRAEFITTLHNLLISDYKDPDARAKAIELLDLQANWIG